MKRKIFTTTALVCCFMVCLAVVADLTGKWAGTLKTPDGSEIAILYNFKVDGGKLTGTADSPQGTVDISDGKITGDDITFSLSVGGVDVKHVCKYYAAGDSISVNIDYNSMKMHTTLTRSK